ncbi:MAG TPA: hypothetical protein VLR49_06530, partial [Ferruginibacter sp.]|nr:hypothetical protein [Ferruginibacter sp.]
MKKNLLSIFSLLFVFLLPAFFNDANGQVNQQDAVHSDRSLHALVSRYVRTPVVRSVKTNGDVYLQRDMTGYLRSNVLAAPAVPQSQLDHGHDHNNDQLIEFLNRPHPNVATLHQYFNAAAAEFNVPVTILKAAAQVQSNWAQVP